MITYEASAPSPFWQCRACVAAPSHAPASIPTPLPCTCNQDGASQIDAACDTQCVFQPFLRDGGVRRTKDHFGLQRGFSCAQTETVPIRCQCPWWSIDSRGSSGDASLGIVVSGGSARDAFLSRALLDVPHLSLPHLFRTNASFSFTQPKPKNRFPFPSVPPSILLPSPVQHPPHDLARHPEHPPLRLGVLPPAVQRPRSAPATQHSACASRPGRAPDGHRAETKGARFVELPPPLSVASRHPSTSTRPASCRPRCLSTHFSRPSRATTSAPVQRPPRHRARHATHILSGTT